MCSGAQELAPPLELEALRQRYKALNESFRRTRIQHVGTGAGFCAEAIGLLKAMLSCLAQETRLVVSAHPRGRGFGLGAGWDDYFFSPFPTVTGRRYAVLNRGHYPAHSRLPGPLVEASHSLTRRFLGADLLQFDSVPLPTRIASPALGMDLDWWSGCKLCLGLMWHMRPEVADEAEGLRRDLGIAGDYTGVHVRRGDKRTEASYVQIEQYAAAICAAEQAPRTVVVACDDATAPLRLAALLGASFHVVAISSPDDRGYDQREFNRLPRDLRRWKTIRFLAEFEALRHSTLAFVTLSSNVGCLLRYARGNSGLVDVS